MSPSDSGIGADIGQAALASSTAVDLAAQYADLDARWKSATAEAAAAAGQPVVRAAVEAFGERHVSVVIALMTRTGALAGSVDQAVESSVDSDQLNAGDFGQALGALSLPLNSQPGK